MEQATLDAFFALTRVISASAITGAASYIAYHQWFTRRLQPAIVWNYVGITLSLVALFRWFVVILLLPDFEEAHDALEVWLPPMTQAGYVLVAMCFIVLTRCRVLHEQNSHPLGSLGGQA